MTPRTPRCPLPGAPAVTAVPRRDPDNVVLCLLAAEEEEAGDAALQIHFTLLRAFCCENDINILRVSNPARLAQLLLPAAGPDPPADLHCVLVTVSPGRLRGGTPAGPRCRPGPPEAPRPGLEPAASGGRQRRSRGASRAPGKAGSFSPFSALFSPSFSFVFPLFLLLFWGVFPIFPPFPFPLYFSPPLFIFPLFLFSPLFLSLPSPLLSLPFFFFPPLPYSAPESKAKLLTCFQA